MIGKTLLHYNILEKIGEGGMGIVYKAQDLNLQRPVAIKFLPPEMSGKDTERKRFESEAQAAAGLNHPNIATIHSIEEVDNIKFIVMEYIDGWELVDVIKKENLSIDKILFYAKQLCEGLKTAHDKSIIHRDIKSSNIMVTKSGQLKIMDFGLAKIANEKKIQESRATVGTISYMAPEQILSEKIEFTTDIWALGVVLFEMVTKKLPFNGSYEQAIVYSILNEEPEEHNCEKDSTEYKFMDIVLKCLKKVKSNRYQLVDEILTDIAEISNGAATTTTDTSSMSALNRIAVLPFANMSSSPEDEYFSDGMTEELISTLSKIQGLRIIARTSIMQYKVISKSIAEIGSELRVGTILQGSIRKAGDKIRISVQLIDTQTEEALWSQNYDRTFDDVFMIQSSIANNVADSLKVEMLGRDKKQIITEVTQSNDAYKNYLKGRYFWNKRTENDLKRCIKYLNQAIEDDPTFALAYAALADAFIIFGDYNFLLPNEAFPKAKSAAEKALEIDPSLAQAHASLACVSAVYYWNWEEAEKEFKKAIDLNPKYAIAYHWYAINLLTPQKRYQEAQEAIKQAKNLDPLSLIITTTGGLIDYFAGDYDEAVTQFEKTLEFDPNFGVTNYFAGWAYAQIGELQKATESIRKATKIFGDTIALKAELGCVYALCGNVDMASSLCKEVEEVANINTLSSYTMYSFAALYACLDMTDKSIYWLQKTFVEKSYRLIYLATDPWFKNVIGDSQMQKLMDQINIKS